MAKLSHFYRYPKDGYIAGVCAGLAAYLGWNVKIIRIVAVASFIFGGGFPILVIYGVLWYLMDEHLGPPPRGDERGYPPTAEEPPRPSGPVSSSELRRRFLVMEERLRNMEECVSSNEYDLRRELRKLES